MSTDEIGRVLKDGQKKVVVAGTVAGTMFSLMSVGHGYYLKRLIDQVDRLEAGQNSTYVMLEKNNNSFAQSIAAMDKKIALIEASRSDLVPRFLNIESEVINNRRNIDIVEMRLDMIEKKIGLKSVFPRATTNTGGWNGDIK